MDYQSEKFVQKTLDKASKGRTTITVSHRLSVIRNADRILFIDKGVVVEDGTHSQLMAMKGRYFEMITAGRLEDGNEDDLINEKSNKEKKVDECQNDQLISAGCLEDEIKYDINNNNNEIKENDDRTNDHFNDERHCFREMEMETTKTEENIQYWTVFKRILNLSKPDWLIMFLASCFACLIGATLPVFAILFGEVYGVSSNYFQ